MDLCNEIVYDVTSQGMICDAIQDVKHEVLVTALGEVMFGL
jgi:hypothetical protein